jgi:hypothetical protein
MMTRGTRFRHSRWSHLQRFKIVNLISVLDIDRLWYYESVEDVPVSPFDDFVSDSRW